MKLNLGELFKDALPLIEKFAPSVAGAIGGPVGLAAGYVLPVLANAFGAHPSDIKELVGKILTDKDAQSKLASIETEHGDWVDSLMDSVGNLTNAKINIELSWQPEKNHS